MLVITLTPFRRRTAGRIFVDDEGQPILETVTAGRLRNTCQSRHRFDVETTAITT
jgi:hypothetical protein